MAGANPTLPGGTALDRAAFLVEVNRAGAVSATDITAAKDNKDQMRIAARAISDLNTIIGSDNRAQSAETQTRVLEALRASPGYRDIIADFVRKKMVDPSMSNNEHSGMVTGRMLGMRPALESIAPIAPQFRQSVTAAVTTPVPPKNLSELGILPTGTDLAEDYNRAKSVLDYIRNSAQTGGPQENKLNPAQMNEVIGAWRRAGYGSYATIMDEQRRNSASGGDPVAAQSRALVALSGAYNKAYETRQTVNVQADLERGRQQALQHLNVDYAQIRQRIPEILREQNGGQAVPVTEAQKDQIMEGVRSAINRIADGFNGLNAERQREIERTINTRIEQAVTSEASRRLGNTDDRVRAAQEGAQNEADARTQAFIERVRAMSPEQREKLCENSGSNPLVQQACKP